jgi:hypothetical protein
MSGALVREVGGRLVFGDAVARIADTLSPLGATARIVAESGAIAVQLRQLGLEGRRVEAEKIETITRLQHRHVAVGSALNEMRRTVDATERNAQNLRQTITNVQREILRPGVSIVEKEIYGDIMKDATAQLVQNHTVGGSALNGHIHEVLNGAGAMASRSSGGRRKRGGAARPRRAQ